MGRALALLYNGIRHAWAHLRCRRGTLGGSTQAILAALILAMICCVSCKLWAMSILGRGNPCPQFQRLEGDVYARSVSDEIADRRMQTHEMA